MILLVELDDLRLTFDGLDVGVSAYAESDVYAAGLTVFDSAIRSENFSSPVRVGDFGSIHSPARLMEINSPVRVGDGGFFASGPRSFFCQSPGRTLEIVSMPG